MRIRCLAGVLGRVTLLIAVSTVAATAVAGQVARLSGGGAARSVAGGGSAESTGADSVAVVPFTNISRDERDDWLGHGIAETVAADLETRDAFAVVALERVAAAMGGGAATRDDTSAAALGRELGSRWVVAGGYQRIGDRLRITARLVDTLSGALAATARVDGSFADIFDLQDRIAGELTRSAGAQVALGAAPAPAGGGRAPFGAGRADLGRVARAGGRAPFGPVSEGDAGSDRWAGGARSRSAWARAASDPGAAAVGGWSSSAKAAPAPDLEPPAGAREPPMRALAVSTSSARSRTVSSAGRGASTRAPARPHPRTRVTAR